MASLNTYKDGPDEGGHFGIFGGRFVAETLMPLILEVEKAYDAAKADPSFADKLNDLLKNYVGRPSPLFLAERLTEQFGGAKIYFKRDELNHTGAHKINNCLGQILLAKRMGKTRIIAETGAGQHGVATATVCALFGLECIVYMGATDVERQKPNVFRMKLLGAEVRAGYVRIGDAERRDERRLARLGRERARYVLSSSVLWRGRTRIRRWCAISSRSSATKPANKSPMPKDGCPIRWSPASAAARTPWVCFIRFSTIPTSP
jgi:hypothetical protein